jgi:CubicO group peptidase (beta-lactamase class C family)
MVLAGAVLERVTGLRQDQAFAELVAAPAGLRRTGYGPLAPEGPAAGSDGDVVEHEMVRTGRPYPSAARVEDFGGWRDEPTIGVPNDGNAAHALAGVAGHAGLFAPVTELARLGAWLVDARVQDPVVLAELLRPLDVAPDRAVGFRLAHLPIGGELVPVAWHAGFTGTVLATALDRELSVAAAASRLHGTTGRLGSPTTPRERLVQLDDVLATTWQGVARALAEADAVPPAASTTTNGAQR